jgi:outer membrane protein OmpA-like peptidoglycan-associated protein
MVSTLLLGMLSAMFQLTSVGLTSVTVPPDSRIEIPLTPGDGDVEARRQDNQTRLEVRIDSIAPITAFGNSMRAYIVWAVSPEGEFENLGELQVDGNEAELDTSTSLQRFGLLVTAEPYFSVDTPGAAVALQSGAPTDSDARSETQIIEVGQFDYSQVSLPPQGNLPSHVIQARVAFLIAEQEAADELADADFRQARIAFDSMEQLLRRENMIPEVLEAYVNDSIRLSARAIQAARARQIEVEVQNATRRADSLQRDNARMSQEIERLDLRSEAINGQLDEIRTDLQAALAENRRLELERDESERQFRTAQEEIGELSNRWIPLVDALISAGARQTPDGIQITLSSERFVDDEVDFADGTREILARLVGIVTFDLLPRMLIESHTSNVDDASEGLARSQQRADAIKEYLVQAGVPEELIRADGFGFSRPVRGIEDLSNPIHERVEILIREP